MCKRISMGICPVCGVWIDSYGRCNCNSRMQVKTVKGLALVLMAILTPLMARCPCCGSTDVSSYSQNGVKIYSCNRCGHEWE